MEFHVTFKINYLYMKIGITTSETSYANYPKWIKGSDDIEIIELSYQKYNLDSFALCDAVVLTGGIDIMPENTNYDNAPAAFNEARDQFESEVLRLALYEKKPVLGICRGLQLINNHFGGDLYLDLAEKNDAHKKGKEDKIHEVYLDTNSLLFEITGQEKGRVNSAHHQSINQLADCLRVSAASGDGVVEAIELKDKTNQFLLAVQWHPERMNDQNSPFTKNIREAFLNTVSKLKK
jgi:putative glutamine amidotransferase